MRVEECLIKFKKTNQFQGKDQASNNFVSMITKKMQHLKEIGIFCFNL